MLLLHAHGAYLQSKFPYIAEEVNKRLGQPAPAPTPSPSTNTYTVQKGDCLSVIGSKLDVKWQDIATLNGIKSPYVIYVGQVLKIPTGNTSASTNNKKSNEQICKEVWQGNWGNGQDRFNRLKAAGYDPNLIQSMVNKGIGK